MTQPTATATPAPGPEGDPLAEELAAIPYEPLLPVEKRLIAGSLLLGVALLGVLLWASSTFFPIQALKK
ncbi:MAG: hypothetical protein JO284_11590 [Planctomycetaceae bacterium]|nr:hypothetical protein [Planctomycetaceae bacterium]MBV8676766.1 hypothetical protein [Planctomycetaceae bacterium]